MSFIGYYGIDKWYNLRWYINNITKLSWRYTSTSSAPFTLQTTGASLISAFKQLNKIDLFNVLGGTGIY